MRSTTAFFACVAVVGCGTPSAPLEGEAAPERDAAAPSVPASPVASAPDSPPASIPDESMYEPTYAERTTVIGLLDMARVAGGKRLQPTVLYPDGGGEPLLLSYRPVRAWFGFVERRVRVVGRPWTPGAETQHVNGAHFEVETITLEDGTLPPELDRLSPATLVDRADGLPDVGRWVRLRGTLKRIEDVDGRWATGVLTVAGGEVRLRQVPVSRLRERLGQDITAVGAVGEGGALEGIIALCEGDDALCGQELDR